MATYTGKATLYEYIMMSIPDGDHIFQTTANSEIVDLQVEFVNIYGDTVYAATPVLGNTTADQRMLILKYHGSLTINSGVTITPQVRKRGMMIFVNGILANNGTISMTARGAAAAGQNVYMYKDLNGNLCFVPAAGAAGLAQASQGSETSGHTSALSGIAGAGRQLGGGAPGAGRGGASGSGAAATSYSGGSGGGGGNNGAGGNAAANGGAGGYGYSTSSFSNSSGGGAGNPGGAGAAGNRGDGQPGADGTGGLLIVHAKDIINNGTLASNGSAGGNAYRAGGGGSGGGHIEVTTEVTPTKIGTTSVVGGARGIGTRGAESGDGGIGGAGTFMSAMATVYMNKFLFQDGNDIKMYFRASDGLTDAVPKMTSNTAPSPISLSASSVYIPNNDCWKAFNNTNVDTDDCWHSNNTDTGKQWLQVDFGAGNQKRIGKYAITTRNNGSFPQSPKNWVFQGSNDALVWDNLHSITGADQTANRRTLYDFSATPAAYRYYRIYITATYSSTGHVAIGELELIEPASQGWSTIGAAPVTKAMFDANGMDSLFLVDDAAIRKLAAPELLVWTDEDDASRFMVITAVPPGRLLMPKDDLIVKNIVSLSLSATVTGAGAIGVLASGDGGVTWMSHASGAWQSIDISDLVSVKANRMTPDQINALTASEWASIVNGGKLRLAYYLEQSSSTDTAKIDQLQVNNKIYTLSPSVSDLSVVFNVLMPLMPELYVSRDDGVTWKQVQPDQLAYLSNLPAGKSLRVKAILSTGQELQGVSYSWV
ncbi:F5/8 type C domain-containing protein [Paenibacillus sp. UNC496MF]|uniref:discoidin domain-containing protein n=1 Tax=Paenibacillus sp. UNC496MF TaxID=1502753 RepID=UPI0008E42592|nr:discoidin domain-containing protein [Paenibacillus sp. UNC496MF]SFJ65919.1 F5/8 type C domain-containing protein [Paenibacillus sp. UNC496MF]